MPWKQGYCQLPGGNPSQATPPPPVLDVLTYRESAVDTGCVSWTGGAIREP